MNWMRRFNALTYEVKAYRVSLASFVVSTLLAIAGFYIAYVSFHLQRLQESEAKRQQQQEESRNRALERAENLEKSKRAAEAFRSDGLSIDFNP